MNHHYKAIYTGYFPAIFRSSPNFSERGVQAFSGGRDLQLRGVKSETRPAAACGGGREHRGMARKTFLRCEQSGAGIFLHSYTIGKP